MEYSIDQICKDDLGEDVDDSCQAEVPNRNSNNSKRKPLENIDLNSVSCFDGYFDQNQNIKNGESSNIYENVIPE